MISLTFVASVESVKAEEILLTCARSDGSDRQSLEINNDRIVVEGRDVHATDIVIGYRFVTFKVGSESIKVDRADGKITTYNSNGDVSFELFCEKDEKLPRKF